MPKKISINFEVNAEESGKRIDVIVSKRHPEFSRMQIKKFIELTAKELQWGSIIWEGKGLDLSLIHISEPTRP